MTRRAIALLLSLAGYTGTAEAGDPAVARTRPPGGDAAQLFRLLGRDAIWTPVSSVEMRGWTTFHTEGLVKIGDTFFVSSVEVLEPTVRNGTATDALYDFSIDRSPGRGRGWLFKFRADGTLLGQVELTHDTIYHPGGIDYDGRHLWVPVAEYRPNSASRIYRVDPDTLAAEMVFTVDDHIGGIVHNVRRGTFHGVSWGSRRLYTWPAGRDGRDRDRVQDASREPAWVPNGSAYVDYQDCHYQGDDVMLCGGVAGYATPAAGNIAFGGLELVDLRASRVIHQVPVNRFVDEGNGANPTLALTHNAFWVEVGESGRALRFYFMTESDNQAALMTYDATPWINR